MSTQSYYKDRLGFDPREALYDGPVKGSRGHSQNSHYTSNGNQDHYATPPKKHKQQHHASYQQPQQQQQNEQQQQGGYEDALTQFKGSMSLWEFFVENSDKLGMSVVCCEKEIQTMHGASQGKIVHCVSTCREKRYVNERSQVALTMDSPETLHPVLRSSFFSRVVFVCLPKLNIRNIEQSK